MPFYCGKRSAGICVVLGPKKSSTYSSEYASGFFEPAASYLPASPSPRNEGLFGQTSSYFLCFFAAALAGRAFGLVFGFGFAFGFTFGLAFAFDMAGRTAAFAGARFAGADFACVSFFGVGFTGAVFLPWLPDPPFKGFPSAS